MSGMTAMTHEYDGGQCWCGPKCDPVEFVWVAQEPAVQEESK